MKTSFLPSILGFALYSFCEFIQKQVLALKRKTWQLWEPLVYLFFFPYSSFHPTGWVNQSQDTSNMHNGYTWTFQQGKLTGSVFIISYDLLSLPSKMNRVLQFVLEATRFANHHSNTNNVSAHTFSFKPLLAIRTTPDLESN